MDDASIRAVKARVEQDLLRRPGVTGVDTGTKRTRGQDTGVVAIRVYVAHKHDVPADQTIPPFIEGVPTDVVERRFVPHRS